MSETNRSQSFSCARWLVLLALCAMTLGCSSKAVEEEADVEPVNESGKFEDLAAEAGIDFHMNFLRNEQGETFKVNLYDHGCGVIIADYDNDGHEDVYFLNQLGANALYRNQGDGTFVDVTKKAGVGLGDRISVAGTFADYDNDGDQDLFVTSTRGGNVLFQNRGDGTFQDVTEQAGVQHVGHSATATFVDLDNDRFLDLIVTNTAKWTLDNFDDTVKYYPGIANYYDFIASPKEENIVYHNNGDGTFSDITEKSGLKGQGWGGDIAVFDYDGDSQLDLVITNMFGASQLYRNQGDGTFADVTKEVLGRVPWGAIGVKVFELNNDGNLDLFISDMHSDMWVPPNSETVLKYAEKNAEKKYPYLLGGLHDLHKEQANLSEVQLSIAVQTRYDDVLFGNALFRNNGQGKWEEISDKTNMETWWPWGIAAGDFDNDGYEDIFLPSGMGYPFSYWPNHLMMNHKGEKFVESAAELGMEPPKKGPHLEEKIGGSDAARSSRCAAVADFDGDGRLEIMVNNFNDHPYYFRNYLPAKNYVAFKLTGTKSNRDAIGAVARLHVGAEVMVRQVNPAGGYLSQSSRTLHFGLGDRAEVDRLEIVWPSGVKQTLEAPDINAVHQVTEPDA